MVRVIAFLLACPSLTLPAFLDEGHHHDDLPSLELGAVHFPVSCAPNAQRRFQQGVALLHSFAFESAEHAFRQVREDDPRCAMAHWGMAKSMWRWATPDPAKREQGLAEVRA